MYTSCTVPSLSYARTPWEEQHYRQVYRQTRPQTLRLLHLSLPMYSYVCTRCPAWLSCCASRGRVVLVGTVLCLAHVSPLHVHFGSVTRLLRSIGQLLVVGLETPMDSVSHPRRGLHCSWRAGGQDRQRGVHTTWSAWRRELGRSKSRGVVFLLLHWQQPRIPAISSQLLVKIDVGGCLAT
jgi:hypothetical protein